MIRIQVGLSKVKDNATQNLRVCRYSDVPTKEGWVDTIKYLPLAFDIMHLRIKGKFRLASGWWNGQNWEGLRLRKDDRITAWKRNFDCD
jgi:hypothetical protein